MPFVATKSTWTPKPRNQTISLPLAMHPHRLPIGIQLGTGPADEHVILRLGAALEEALPWKGRMPPLHASRVA